jgi:predicted acyltransferase
LLSHFSPLNKLIWTSTFALFSSGVSLILFAILFAIVDLRRVRWWTPPALVLGTNAILAFVLSSIITVVIRLIFVHSSDGARITLRDWIYQHLLAIGLAPINASLAYAMVIVLLNMAVIVPLYRKRMFLKI